VAGLCGVRHFDENRTQERTDRTWHLLLRAHASSRLATNGRSQGSEEFIDESSQNGQGPVVAEVEFATCQLIPGGESRAGGVQPGHAADPAR